MIKRICMLSTHGYFDPVPQLGRTDTGGQVLFVLQLARALSRHDLEVDIYTRWFDRSKMQIDPLPGCPDVRVVRIPAGGWEFIAKESIYDVLPELAENMIDFVRGNNLNYDLFHGHYVDAGIVALRVAEAFSRPAFFTAHSLGAWKKQMLGGDPVEMNRIFNFDHRIAEELRIFQSVRALTTTSMEEKDKIQELYGFRPPRLEFIPAGVDVHKFRPLAEDEREENTGISMPSEYIFVVSRLAKAKGHDLLLPAFARVLEEFPDIHLVIAGGSRNPGDEEIDVLSSIKHFVEKNQIANKVHIIGGVTHDALPSYFRQAKLFILPARYEPFGMTALEAMSCRVPTIISKFAGIQESLHGGEDCLIVNPLETGEYAEAIISILKNSQLANRLAESGYRSVQEKFSWEAIARRFLDFYKRHLNI